MVVPQSVAERVADWSNQSWIDIIWQAAVLIGAILLAAALISFGAVGVVIGFVIVSFMFRESIQDALTDIWERNFWRPR